MKKLFAHLIILLIVPHLFSQTFYKGLRIPYDPCDPCSGASINYGKIAILTSLTRWHLILAHDLFNVKIKTK